MTSKRWSNVCAFGMMEVFDCVVSFMNSKLSSSKITRRPKLLKGRVRVDSNVRKAMLDQQLDHVVEPLSQPTITRAVFPPSKTETESRSTAVVLSLHAFEERGVHTDTVSEHDDLLLAHLHEPKRVVQTAKRVPVRVAPHVPSDHQIELDATITPISYDEHPMVDRSIDEWLAPYQEPPSHAELIDEAERLHVTYIDPKWFGEQFTPHEYVHAYNAQFSPLSQLALWFSRYEAASVRLKDGRIAPMPKPIVVPAVEMPITISWGTLVEEEEVPHQVREFKGEKEGVFTRLASWFRSLRAEEREIIEETKEAWGVPVVVPRIAITRVMVGLFGLLIVISLPAGAVSLARSFGGSVEEVQSQSKQAFAGLSSASFDEAGSRFRQADEALTHVNAVVLALSQVVPSTRTALTSVQALLSAGAFASDAGKTLRGGIARALTEPVLHADERLYILKGALDTATPMIEEAATDIDRVDAGVLPENTRAQFEEAKQLVHASRDALRDLRDMVKWMIPIVGHDRARTYLLVFQNHTELRPSGGFMGSFAEVDVDRGEIKRMRVPGGGPYDMKSQLRTRVIPPEPLQLVSSRWEFQDVNWFGDFPTTARTVNWFWSKSGQPTVDGIIAVNATTLPRLLTLTGPLQMPEYGKTITAENVLLETQKSVELEYDPVANTPKKFIADLLTQVTNRLKTLSQDQSLAFADLLATSLSTKEVQLYFTDPEEQTFAERMGWTGSWKTTIGDSLALIEANIAGQKTSASIHEQVEHVARIQEDGAILDRVTITRTHNARKGDLFSGVNNVTYARVYVPRGSELISASGFTPPKPELFDTSLPGDEPHPELTGVVGATSSAYGADIFEEASSTVFGGWIQLEPGATHVITFEYRLPFTIFDLARIQAEGIAEPAPGRGVYTMLLTSQSGAVSRTLTSRVDVPSRLHTAWSKGTDVNGAWNRDQAYGLLFDSTSTTRP